MTEAVLPVTFDRDTGYFFQAAREGRLVYRACKSCGRAIHMPTQFCGRCGGRDTHWCESKGAGTLFTWTTVTHAVHPAYPVPYTVVVVALNDAPEVRLIGQLRGAPSLTAGQPMKVWFERVNDEVTLPQWAPA